MQIWTNYETANLQKVAMRRVPPDATVSEVSASCTTTTMSYDDADWTGRGTGALWD